MAGRLEGKIAHITGGGSGLGDAMAHLFAQEGARVAVSDLKLEAAQSVAELRHRYPYLTRERCGLALGQMKLLLSGIHPHVANAHHSIRVASKS